MKPPLEVILDGTAIDQIRGYVDGVQSRLVDYKDIMDSLGVTKPQLKYALAVLIEQGVLRRVVGRGMYEKTDFVNRQQPTAEGLLEEMHLELKQHLWHEFETDCHRFRARYKGERIG